MLRPLHVCVAVISRMMLPGVDGEQYSFFSHLGAPSGVHVRWDMHGSNHGMPWKADASEYSGGMPGGAQGADCASLSAGGRAGAGCKNPFTGMLSGTK
eukprot:97277-Rhodomonas_salina.1